MTRIELQDNGTFDVWDGRRVNLVGATSAVRYRDAAGESRTVRTSRRVGEGLTGNDENVRIDLEVAEDTLTLQVRNLAQASIQLDAFHVLECDSEAGGKIRWDAADELRYLHHGWQSWSQTAMRSMAQPESAFDGDGFAEKHLPYGKAEAAERTSNAFTLIGNTDAKRGLLLGMSGARQFTQIRCEVRNNRVTRVRALAYGDGIRLAPNEAAQAEDLMMRFGDAAALYQYYAHRIGVTMGKRGTAERIAGWCSWYYYYGQNTADDVRANLGQIVAADLPLDLVLIDDGYETAIGDWTSVKPDKFPLGMKAAADEIHAAGKRAGIWLAPFGANEDSAVAKAHPEFFLRDANGAPVIAWNHWGESVYALDLTRPDVEAWLRELFHTVGHEWGYDAVKIDFIFAGALPGNHADPTLTRAEAYRCGVEAIIEGLGPGKLILGCGAPQLAAVGLVDTMRVSQDVNFTWEVADPLNTGGVSTELAVQNTLLRSPLNQEWWLNDPDCVILRQFGDLNAMSPNENRTLASVAALTGSILLDSDNLVTIKPAYLNDLRRVLPPLKQTARVRDWFSYDGAQPAQLELELEDGRHVLAALNWSNRKRETTIGLPGPGKWHVYDFWAKRYLGMFSKQVTIAKHTAHQTVVLQCTPATRAAGLVASSFHISNQDIRGIARSKRGLELALASAGKLRGEVLLSVPRGKRAIASVNGKTTRVVRCGNDVIALRFQTQGETKIQLEWD